jgi:hypothetical protein
MVLGRGVVPDGRVLWWYLPGVWFKAWENNVIIIGSSEVPDGRRLLMSILKTVLNCSQRVLDQLKEHVVQMACHIRKCEVGFPIQRDLGCTAILTQTDGTRIVHCVLGYLHWAQLGADEAAVVGLGGLMQRNVLAWNNNSIHRNLAYPMLVAVTFGLKIVVPLKLGLKIHTKNFGK